MIPAITFFMLQMQDVPAGPNAGDLEAIHTQVNNVTTGLQALKTQVGPGTGITKGLWAHNPNLVKIHVKLAWRIMIRSSHHFAHVVFKHILVIDVLNISCKIAHRWMAQDLIDEVDVSGNGWAPSGNKLLPDPVLTQIYDTDDMATLEFTGIRWDHYRVGSWARFLSLALSKLRLCSANHRPGYWSNLPCDWPSTAWAYSEQDTENGLRSQQANQAIPWLPTSALHGASYPVRNRHNGTPGVPLTTNPGSWSGHPWRSQRLTRCGCHWNGGKQPESEVVINMKHVNSAYTLCNSLIRPLMWFVFTWGIHFWCLFWFCVSFDIFIFSTGCWLNHWTMGAQQVATPAVPHSHPPCSV